MSAPRQVTSDDGPLTKSTGMAYTACEEGLVYWSDGQGDWAGGLQVVRDQSTEYLWAIKKPNGQVGMIPKATVSKDDLSYYDEAGQLVVPNKASGS